MRYPAIYVTKFWFGTDEAGITAVIGSTADVLCDVSLVFCCIIVTFEMSSNILSASNV